MSERQTPYFNLVIVRSNGCFATITLPILQKHLDSIVVIKSKK